MTTALASINVQHVLDSATGTMDITDLTADGTVKWRIRVSLDDGNVYMVDFSLR